jgi:hypothetical protein
MHSGMSPGCLRMGHSDCRSSGGLSGSSDGSKLNFSDVSWNRTTRTTHHRTRTHAHTSEVTLEGECGEYCAP